MEGERQAITSGGGSGAGSLSRSLSTTSLSTAADPDLSANDVRCADLEAQAETQPSTTVLPSIATSTLCTSAEAQPSTVTWPLTMLHVVNDPVTTTRDG